MGHLEGQVRSVFETFSRGNFNVVEVRFPKERSVDVVARRKGQRAVVKVTSNPSRMALAEFNELRKLATAYGASPIVVAQKYGTKTLEDDVVYKKDDVFIVSQRLLENYIVRGVKPLVIGMGGRYFVELDAAKFVRRLRELGMKRSELAEAARISKKSVYLYEQGARYMSLEVAIRVADVLGEDLFVEQDILKCERRAVDQDSPSDSFENLLYAEAQQRGMRFYKLSRTPIDFVLGGERSSLSVTILSEGVGDESDAKEKLENAEDVASAMGSDHFVLRSKDESELRRALRAL
ncbi:MAG: helix-turn-helix domain-containing protein [Desulfurococcaceae archaeon]